MDRDDLIRLYFQLGLSYRDIASALALNDDIILSERHIKRLLRDMGLSRRSSYSAVAGVIGFVQEQLQGSGKLHGYRWIHQKCLDHGLKFRKEDVRLIMGVLDPQGAAQRKKRSLTRRRYSANSPNFIWHIDSYDKLKPFGICLNGCIDGFSRKIIWMNVYNTSSDSRVIGGYYIEAVESLGGCPTVMRADLGTENVRVKYFQRYLRRDGRDARAGERSFLVGRSTANQRIEYWWSFLRRECTDF